MNTEFLARLKSGPILCDGAMGTQIYARGISFEHCFDELNLSQPEAILDIHRRYIEAGAEIIETNTFGGNRFRLIEHGLDNKIAEINQAGVKLARQAANESRRTVFVAGSVGPLGVRLAPLGRVNPADAQQAFKEQIAALNAAGVDLLIIETFSDLNEIEQAIKAAREVNPDLPIVAQMTFTEDGFTPLGESPDQVAHRLIDLNVDVFGANCSVGPARLLPVIQTLTRHAQISDRKPFVSIQPNAGWPQRIGPRLMYPATPDYFGDYTRRFLEAGATIIGGCCGTTPNHIRSMRAAIDGAPSHLITIDLRTPADQAAPDRSGEATKIAPTGLAQKFADKKFVTAVEVDPPRGHNPSRIIEAARELKHAGFDVINVADTPLARMRMSAWALAHLIQREADLETVLHFPTRGRNLIRVQGDLLAAHALGIRNLLAVMGDPSSVGDYPEASDQHDIVPSGLVKMIKQHMNTGTDHSGTSIGSATSFHVAVAVNFNAADLDREIKTFRRKILAGADFAISQPIFEVGCVRAFFTRYHELYGRIPIPIMGGVLPPASVRNAEFLHNELPGMHLPDWALDRMRQAVDGRQEGIKIAQEALLQLREWLQGVYVMPMLGRYDSAGEVIEVVKDKA
ncbi:MAG TPA: bifunctional homocysteine S-methyltransferase/methylenetetrahydrofolate reductase [Anaerolineae bacterium]|nr:bifunctional homocysteine S-methyltransferase/methylenetetrahydrofolate reductase [Anaerolineae bacterium]